MAGGLRAYNGVNGFAIGQGYTHADDEITDHRDALALYDTLENQVIPCFYDRDTDGLPKEWIKRMMHSISTLAWRFSSHRMVADYSSASVPVGRRRRDLRHALSIARPNGGCLEMTGETPE